MARTTWCCSATPNMGLVTDLTGDGKDDLVLLCHDRVLLYPQQAQPAKSGRN